MDEDLLKIGLMLDLLCTKIYLIVLPFDCRFMSS